MRSFALQCVVVSLTCSGCIGLAELSSTEMPSQPPAPEAHPTMVDPAAPLPVDSGVVASGDAGVQPVDAGVQDAGVQSVDAAPPPVPVDDAALGSVQFPGQLTCAESASATLELRNTGNTTWTKAGGYFLGAVDDSDPLVAAARVELSDTARIAPGETVRFTLPLLGSSASGAVTSDWRLRHDATPFGATATQGVTIVCQPAPPFSLGAVTIIGSPDVRGFPITSDLTSLEFSPGRIHVDHTKRGQWPPVVIDPNDGTTQEATIWIFFAINGAWYGTGGERLRPSQTDKMLDRPSIIGADWFYDANRWGVMAGYTPQPGDLVGFMIVAGSTRADNQTPVQERTGAVLINFPADGVTATYPAWAWREL